jgi:hypothetical protein
MSLIKLAAPRWFKEIKKMPDFFKNKTRFDDAIIGNKDNTRKELSKIFSIRRDLDDLKMSLPERARNTFKYKNYLIRLLDKDNNDFSIKYNTDQIKDWLSNPNSKHLNLAIGHFKIMNTKQKTIPIIHFSLSDKLNKNSKYFSESSGVEGYGTNKIFSIPLSGQSKKAIEKFSKKTIGKSYISHAPISKVIFKGNGTMGQMGGPEVISNWSDFANGMK